MLTHVSQQKNPLCCIVSKGLWISFFPPLSLPSHLLPSLPSLPFPLHARTHAHLGSLEGDGRKLPTGGRCAGGEGNTVGGATGYLGDPVIFESENRLRLAITDGTAVALLSMLIVSPRKYLQQTRNE